MYRYATQASVLKVGTGLRTGPKVRQGKVVFDCGLVLTPEESYSTR